MEKTGDLESKKQVRSGSPLEGGPQKEIHVGKDAGKMVDMITGL